MTKRNQVKSTGEFSVKAVITKDFEVALQIIDNKLGIARADVVRAALKEHIDKNYPGYLPRSGVELKMQARERALLAKYQREYVDKAHVEKWEPVFDKSIKETSQRMDKLIEKLIDDVGKTDTIDFKDKKRQFDLRNKLVKSAEELFDIKYELFSDYSNLKELRGRKSRLSKFL